MGRRTLARLAATTERQVGGVQPTANEEADIQGHSWPLRLFGTYSGHRGLSGAKWKWG